MEKKDFSKDDFQILDEMDSSTPESPSTFSSKTPPPVFRVLSFRANTVPRWLIVVIILAVVICVIGLILLIAGAVKSSSSSESCATTQGDSDSISAICKWSAEANRVKLADYFTKVQNTYYKMAPESIAWHPGFRGSDLDRVVKERYAPYNPAPLNLKQTTDVAFDLLQELKDMKINTDQLKPRESKAVAQTEHYLQHVFGSAYDSNYYAGDWMLGPNLFCWMPVCSIGYSINSFAYHFKPKTYSDVQHVITTIMKHKDGLEQYRKNVEAGVKAGMVRATRDCVSGVDALKEKFREVSLANESSGVLQEWFVKQYTADSFVQKLDKGVDDTWKANHGGNNVSESVESALVDGIGQPILDLINYLEFDHMKHCVPDNVSSGLANLPLDYVYVNDVPDKNQPTTKQLPTGEKLNGKATYKKILSYFTTTDISPTQIYEEGKSQLDYFYSEVKKIAKTITNETDETEAITAFKKMLNSSEMWHNKEPFPEIESNKTAHTRCISPETAAKYCPVRWKAIQRWASFCQEIMGILYPKIYDIFYFTGAKITAPNCPIDMLPHYNPSNGAQFFRQSDSRCSRSSKFGLPFFLKDYGPVFQEWSVTAHESRPGHHTQIQAHIEHFRDQCGGYPSWLDMETYYTAFTEGWGLYSENPLVSDDTDSYKNNLLQKYGMLKWQTWRAVRLIVDTGLHDRGMTRDAAMKMFEDYAWDTSDFANKEVTRYMSDPGQATAYMLGRLQLIQARNRTHQALGKKFSKKDFHYQVLSQGSAPLSFLNSHIDKYIKCATNEITGEACDYILKPPKKRSKSAATSQKRAPAPKRRHFI